jgi:hypothetical protein
LRSLEGETVALVTREFGRVGAREREDSGSLRCAPCRERELELDGRELAERALTVHDHDTLIAIEWLRSVA